MAVVRDMPYVIACRISSYAYVTRQNFLPCRFGRLYPDTRFAFSKFNFALKGVVVNASLVLVPTHQ